MRTLVLAGLVLAPLLAGCERRETPPVFEYPDEALDVAYGPYARNVLDLWRPESIQPTPLAVFIHGGGFVGGSKENLELQERDELLAAGIAVATINYRLATTDPLPAAHLDAGRALQFLRARATEWGLDPSRVCVWGTSAGGALSMWLATRDDLADASASDPVARESTRVTCAAPIGGQSTLDRAWIREWIGGNLDMHPSFPLWFGVESYEELDTPQVQAVMDEISSLLHASADDAPMYMAYGDPNVPVPDDAPPREGGHHPIFGLKLAELLEGLGVEATVVIQGRAQGEDPYGSPVQFMKVKLGAG